MRILYARPLAFTAGEQIPPLRVELRDLDFDPSGADSVTFTIAKWWSREIVATGSAEVEDSIDHEDAQSGRTFYSATLVTAAIDAPADAGMHYAFFDIDMGLEGIPRVPADLSLIVEVLPAPVAAPG